MLDLRLIRSDPERVKQALARRGAADGVDELLALDARRRELLPEIENAQAERKTLSKQVGEAKQRGEEADDLIARVGGLKETIESGKAELEKVDADLDRVAGALPNLPDPDAPDGMRRRTRSRCARWGRCRASTSSPATTSRSAPTLA